MARDKYHNLVKTALINDGWSITHDPYPLRKWNPDWEIDLGAEKMIAAEKGSEKIAVEIKSFLAASFGNEFHTILGQYINYCLGLSQIEPERILYLAVPSNIWETEFQRSGIQFSVNSMKVKIIVYDLEAKKIEKWITYSKK